MSYDLPDEAAVPTEPEREHGLQPQREEDREGGPTGPDEPTIGPDQDPERAVQNPTSAPHEHQSPGDVGTDSD
jgi:hypothetical protein